VSDRYKEMWEDAFHDNLEKKAEISELKAENARLKSEVEKWKSWAEAENAEKKVLKAEVERLRKAGDGMEEVIWLNGCVSGMQIKERAVKAWKQAKEGKV